MFRFLLKRAPIPAAVLGLAGCVQNASEPPARPDLPTPVQAAVDANFPGAHVVHHWRDNVDGRPVCEATLRQDGKTFDAAFAVGGQLVQVETRITGGELPAAVSKAVAAQHRDLQLVKAEEIQDPQGEPRYEITSSGKGIWIKSRYDRRGLLIFETKMQDSNK